PPAAPVPLVPSVPPVPSVVPVMLSACPGRAPRPTTPGPRTPNPEGNRDPNPGRTRTGTGPNPDRNRAEPGPDPDRNRDPDPTREGLRCGGARPTRAPDVPGAARPRPGSRGSPVTSRELEGILPKAITNSH